MSESEKTRWDKWSKERPENELLVKRAKKILTMPFRELDVNCDDSGQLDRLIKAIKDEGDEE